MLDRTIADMICHVNNLCMYTSMNECMLYIYLYALLNMFLLNVITNHYRCLKSQILICVEALLPVLLPLAQSSSRIPQCSSLPPMLPSSWSGPAPLLPLHPPPFLFRPAEQLE